MRKYFIAAIAMLVCATARVTADPVEGFWLSVDDKTGKETAGWEMYQKNGRLYGKILSRAGSPQDVTAKNCKASYANFPLPGKVNEMSVLGTPWIFGLIPDGNGRWSGGSIINPEDGNMYRCSIIHHPADGKKFLLETLEIRGQILVFSGSQYWRRTTREEAGEVR